eukprot:6175990-Pleurochrysis_carterae.AAC.1
MLTAFFHNTTGTCAQIGDYNKSAAAFPVSGFRSRQLARTSQVQGRSCTGYLPMDKTSTCD